MRFITLLPLPFRFSSLSGQTLELRLCALYYLVAPAVSFFFTFGADFRIALVRFITLLPLPFRFSSLSGQTLELRLCALYYLVAPAVSFFFTFGADFRIALVRNSKVAVLRRLE
ncbi:hypothetical protein [Lysinibacillus parviboronicapiens]|uniref:hypothetical protein n=1 Tax=Lysinibacillus parviboronicapiens TaxID=436516 RepID=UPI001B8D01EB|nr:hypothetical protein [Lysinibacillus parviboronicapiens]